LINSWKEISANLLERLNVYDGIMANVKVRRHLSDADIHISIDILAEKHDSFYNYQHTHLKHKPIQILNKT
jgi:hypothetical protein